MLLSVKPEDLGIVEFFGFLLSDERSSIVAAAFCHSRAAAGSSRVFGFNVDFNGFKSLFEI